MSDSHDVSFRDADDQPCPNCGTVVEKFEATRSYPEYADWAGYECPDCDVRWDWEEWADGVEKHPDPDPQHGVADLPERKLKHAHRDIHHALEGDRFHVETPRVWTPQDTFQYCDWGLQRDSETYHGYNGLAGVSYGPPYLVLELGWEADDWRLLEDLRQHGELEGPCILYGDMHLWRMDEQMMCDLTAAHRGGEATAEFSWRAVEEVGWR